VLGRILQEICWVSQEYSRDRAAPRLNILACYALLHWGRSAKRQDHHRPVHRAPLKLVRINQSRSPVPPSAGASMQSTAPQVQTESGIRALREGQSLKELILEYHRLTMISPRENSSLQVGTPDSSQTPVPALASEVNRPNAQANAGPVSSAPRPDSARVIPPKILNIAQAQHYSEN
jgi:hypothetical protein